MNLSTSTKGTSLSLKSSLMYKTNFRYPNFTGTAHPSSSELFNLCLKTLPKPQQAIQFEIEEMQNKKAHI